MSDDLREIVTDLVDRVDQLESELEEEREKHENAEQKAGAAVAHCRQLWNRIEGTEDIMSGNISGLHSRINDTLSDPNGRSVLLFRVPRIVRHGTLQMTSR
jgi:predicted  nucleic acid-binding Zn-ribbon protein